MVGKSDDCLVAFFLGTSLSAGSQAQDIKLYVFSSGALTIGKGVLQNNAPMTPEIQVPVGFLCGHASRREMCYSIRAIMIRSSPTRPIGVTPLRQLKPVNTPDVAIDTQLQKIGLKPDDIKYVVVSHLHLDHGGNVAKFPNSTIVVQKSEIQNAFWPAPGTGGPYMIGDFLPLRKPNADNPNAVNMAQLEGDMDLFGDGTVVVKRWVGHTPGSQMMTVRLKNRGLTILTGDNVYFRENVEKNLPPNIVLGLFAEWYSQRLRVDPLPDGDGEGGLLYRA